jgi:hypothetical protein
MSALFDKNGTQLFASFVTNRLGFDQSLGMAFNPSTGTFLAVSNDATSYEVGAVELNVSGAPNSAVQLVTDGARLGSFYPMTASRPGTDQWDVIYARDFAGATSQIVASASRLGGGPVTGPPPPPPPPLPPGGCATPDPFAALGGGRCVNGGWLPPAGGVAPPPPPPPPPPPNGCTTPDPFAAIGGGTCLNGGWVPRFSSCSTPDPFASLGGGLCVNGGWVPRSASGSVCSTPDPFAAIGGGTCVNGGWKPRASLDRLPDLPGGAGGTTLSPRDSLRSRTRPENRPVSG